MTLHDSSIPWDAACLDCDDCGTHTHIPLADAADPRMSTRADGWMLDVNGKDYCPECKTNAKN